MQLAAVTRKDSLAMKTIAITTMAFLPATFFAALFSVPTLQWSQPEVVSDRFWIYPAFALPATVAVFLVWTAWSRWELRGYRLHSERVLSVGLPDMEVKEHDSV
jgi:hypothetical protein